jgi:hypothetical protein
MTTYVYDITIEVVDPEITAKTLRELLADAGVVLEVRQWKQGDQ